MKTVSPSSILLLLCVGIAIYFAFQYRAETIELRKSNAELRSAMERLSRDTPRNEVATSQTVVSVNSDDALADENRTLKNTVEQLHSQLAIAEENQKKLQLELDEVLKPIREEMFSSTLNAHLATGDVLVTGGYQTSDGHYQYAMVEPQIETLPDGRTAVRLKTHHFSMSPTASEMLGLDSMNTAAENTLQHGEVWTGEELKQVVEKDIPATKGVTMIMTPEIVALPGSKSEIHIGDYRASFIPEISADGKSVDLEFRMEEPNEGGG